ncbi:MAG: MFS transporter [Candidatus Altiarchaeota archaeon]
MSYGIFFSFSVFFKPLQNEFGCSRALTSGVFSVHTVVYSISSIIMGRMIDRFGSRLMLGLSACFIGVGMILSGYSRNIWDLYIYYGVVASIGSGVVWTLPTVTITEWFERNKGLALGISFSGIGLGSVVLSPLSDYLIRLYDWRIALLIMGCAFWLLLLILAILVLVDSPAKLGLKPYGARMNLDDHAGTLSVSKGQSQPRNERGQKKGWSRNEAIKTKSFWQAYAVHLFSCFPLVMVMVHIVPFATDRGISSITAASALGLAGLFSILGRIVLGASSDKIGFKNGIFFSSSACVLTLVWLMFTRNTWMLYVFSIVFGFFYGGRAPLLPGLIGEFFGARSLGELIGLLTTAYAIAGLAGPLFAGYAFDKTGSYYLAFGLATMSYAASAIFAFYIRPPRKETEHSM